MYRWPRSTGGPAHAFGGCPGPRDGCRRPATPPTAGAALRLPRLAAQLTSGATAFASRLTTSAAAFTSRLTTLTPGRAPLLSGSLGLSLCDQRRTYRPPNAAASPSRENAPRRDIIFVLLIVKLPGYTCPTLDRGILEKGAAPRYAKTGRRARGPRPGQAWPPAPRARPERADAPAHHLRPTLSTAGASTRPRGGAWRRPR